MNADFISPYEDLETLTVNSHGSVGAMRVSSGVMKESTQAVREDSSLQSELSSSSVAVEVYTESCSSDESELERPWHTATVGSSLPKQQ